MERIAQPDQRDGFLADDQHALAPDCLDFLIQHPDNLYYIGHRDNVIPLGYLYLQPGDNGQGKGEPDGKACA
ncbi:hypothetical protein D3C80_2003780 [compost metagenome]